MRLHTLGSLLSALGDGSGPTPVHRASLPSEGPILDLPAPLLFTASTSPLSSCLNHPRMENLGHKLLTSVEAFLTGPSIKLKSVEPHRKESLDPPA